MGRGHGNGSPRHKKWRQCTNCGKTRFVKDAKCRHYVDGERLYCGYMRVIERG